MAKEKQTTQAKFFDQSAKISASNRLVQYVRKVQSNSTYFLGDIADRAFSFQQADLLWVFWLQGSDNLLGGPLPHEMSYSDFS